MKSLCQMSRKKQLSFLAEGFPIILSSARNYRNAALQIRDSPREACVLNGFSKEEAAKILILMDVVRCPDSLLNECLPKMCKWFYNHHVRLIYAEAASVTGYDVVELQREYADFMRKSLRIDGPGAPIVPQWELWEREANLYADVASTDDGIAYWHAPLNIDSLESFMPALEVVDAMCCLGFFTPRGVSITSNIWGKYFFTKISQSNAQEYPRWDVLLRENVRKLFEEGLVRDNATDRHVQTLLRFWQVPMYDLDFSLERVSLGDIKKGKMANELLDCGYSLDEILEMTDCG